MTLLALLLGLMAFLLGRAVLVLRDGKPRSPRGSTGGKTSAAFATSGCGGWRQQGAVPCVLMALLDHFVAFLVMM